MKKLILLILLLLVISVSFVEAAIYCISDNGGAGSKTVVTDCSNMANCMKESVHNGETFSTPPHTILVCPNDGVFESQVTTPSSGGSGTEIRYVGQYSPTYGWPVFDEGFEISANYIMAYGFEVRPGVAESGTKTFEGIRIADTSRSWQAAEETPVTDWITANKFIVGVGMGMTAGGDNLTPEIRWRDKTDSGSWTVLASSGELKYGDCTALTDNNDVIDDSPGPSEFGTSSGKTQETGVQGEQEDGAIAGTTTTLTAEQYTEIQACFDPAGADDAHEYAFAGFEGGTQVGSESLATITVCKPASLNSNIKFFWRAEGTDLSGGVDDYSAGDTSANPYDGATINATRVKMGSNSMDFQLDGCTTNGGEMYQFDDSLDNIFDGAQGRVGFWWNRDCGGSETALFHVREDTSGYYIMVYQFYGKLRFTHADGSSQTCTISDYLDDDTWYWIDVVINVAGDSAALSVFNESGSLVTSCSFSSGISDITPSGGLDMLQFGNQYNNRYGDQFIDHAIISSDPSTSLWKYANDPTYSICVN